MIPQSMTETSGRTSASPQASPIPSSEDGSQARSGKGWGPGSARRPAARSRPPFGPGVAALALLAGVGLEIGPAWATTGDVFETFTPGQLACAGAAVARLVDIDQDGTFETQVVLTTIEGEAQIQPAVGPGQIYFFSFIDSHCGGSPPFRPKGRVLIRFVDTDAPGWVEGNPATWTYKRVPAVSVSASHDLCAGEGDRNPYLQISAYRNIQRQDNIPANLAGAAHRFSDPVGIAEIFATTDYCESQLDDLILYDSPQGFGGSGADPEVAVVMDTSGSMNLGHDGSWGVPASQQRSALARQAVEPFLVMLRDHYAGRATFGIDAFPDNLNLGYCTGYEARAMETVGAAAIGDAIANTLPGLPVAGNTPLLGGLTAARGTFATAGNRAIVLLSDGYHNCPGPVGSGDPQIASLVGALNLDGIAVHAVGFGLPTDIDHPVLEAISQQTSGQFYDVTGAGFDPAAFSPAVALQETYKNIAVNTLGLEGIVDPIATIAPGAKHSHEVRISPYETKATFFVGWTTPQPRWLEVSLVDSFGRTVALAGAGVKTTDGNTYRLITMDAKALSGRVGKLPWRLNVAAPRPKGEATETYQYSVVGQSALRMRPIVHSERNAPGEPLTLVAQLSLKGKPLPDLDTLWVDIRGPAVVDGKPRKAREMQTLPLFDNGTHGDAQPGDGIYTLVYPGPKDPGTYSFDFRVSDSLGLGVFERLVRVNRSLGSWARTPEGRIPRLVKTPGVKGIIGR